jgi:hypothetical protein
MDRIPKIARLSIWLAGLLFGLSLVAILLSVADGEIAVAVPPSLWIVFLIPIVAVVPTVVSVLYAIRLWGRREGRPTVRVLYCGATLVFCLFLWQLWTWNMLGWNY